MEMNEQAYNVTLGTIPDELPPPPDGAELAPSSPQIVEFEIRDMIVKRKEASREFYEQRRLIWDRCWNHYKQIYDTTNKEAWQSTIFIPASPKVAEVITSNMHSALLAPDRPVEYQPRQPHFETPVRDANDLVAVDMEKSQFKIHATDVLRSLCVIGTGVGKVEYKKEYADVQVKERFQENPVVANLKRMMGLPPAPTETFSTKRMTVKDHASIRYVDRYDCFPEPGTVDICKDKWFIERGRICNYELLRLAKESENPVINITDEVLSSTPKDLKDPDGDKSEKQAALGEDVNPTAYLDPDQEHELLEYWGPAPLWMVEPEAYGDESRKYEIVHAWFWLIDGQHVVRRQRTPWRDAEPPYFKGVYIRVPGQFDGIGPLELMYGLQIELNEGVNCRQDEINLKLNAPLAVIKDLIPQGEWGRLVNGPGALWPITGTDDARKAIYKVDIDGNLGDSWRATALWMQEIQEVTAANKSTVGAGGAEDEAGGGTFRGQLLNKQAASERFIMYARIFEATGLSDAVRKMYQRIYQFKSFEEVAKILGEERMQNFQFVTPEDLDIMAKLVPLGVTSMENKGVQLAQMAEEFKMFSQFPWFKQLEAARKMVIQRGQSDPDAILFSDEEMKLFNEGRRAVFADPSAPAPTEPGSPSPIAGNTPPDMGGLPMPAQPARGPGASPIDSQGMPMS